MKHDGSVPTNQRLQFAWIISHKVRFLHKVSFLRARVSKHRKSDNSRTQKTTTEDISRFLRREGFILSTRFSRIDLMECFFLFHLNRRRRGMTDRWQCENTCLNVYFMPPRPTHPTSTPMMIIVVFN